MKKKVLIVEDSEWEQKNYRKKLAEKIEIIPAFSTREAKDKFLENIEDLDAIVMDACVPGEEPNTLTLTGRFKKIFHGPIIATSSINEYNEMLLKAGCTHKSFKHDLPERLMEILSE